MFSSMCDLTRQLLTFLLPTYSDEEIVIISEIVGTNLSVRSN